ncbi:MAG TPA: Stk1 family PASTA domain-containing Ser/Thr kinase, partial [Miltoncostaeaceae bacterium]|nr:Stk1 family PASTA domain-containing Ser/Thr kinase [Miltoncostaeaceae bacterium]
MSFRPGDLIGDRYELGPRLGTGGMARVHLAHDRLLDRQVAIKVLSDRFADDPQFVERFRREASAAAGLNHPNIVAVYDRGEADGTYYIVMEYLPGPDLKRVIRERAPLPPLEAIDNALQILAALGAAHRRDVIHRDVKPQNVLLSEDGQLKVTDFGIARAGAQSGMTEAGSVIGTAQYLSPEQARGDDVTAASDCYAAGIVLYEMLTGRVPFDADRPVAVAMKQISDPPTPPSDLAPGIPPALEGVVLHSLAKRPSGRYRTGEGVSRALLDVRAQIDGGTGATRIIPPVGAIRGDAEGATRVMAAQPTATTRVQAPRGAPVAPPEPPARHRRRWWIAAAVVALLIVVGGAFALLSSGGGGDTVPVPDVTNMPAAAARSTLEKAGFTVVSRNQADDTVARGRVIRTDPPANERADRNSTVTMFVSAGTGLITVPDVVGNDTTSAQADIIRAGFSVKVVKQADDTVAEGLVIRQDPPGGSQAARNATVTLIVSTGPADVVVPNLNGLTQDQARASLKDAGLVLGGVSTRESDLAAPGLVIGQSPGQGQKIARGDSVDIVLAEAPEPDTIAVPSVIGNYASDAEAKLGTLGFAVSTTTTSSSKPAGIVIDQSPPPLQNAPRGSRVTITVSSGPEPTTPTEPATPTTPTTPTQTTPTAPPETTSAQPPPPNQVP